VHEVEVLVTAGYVRRAGIPACFRSHSDLGLTFYEPQKRNAMGDVVQQSSEE
jgi:hypothetical protein